MYKILVGIPAIFVTNEYLNDKGIIIDKEVYEESDLFTDFELVYRNNHYVFCFETFLGFESKDKCKEWIHQCLQVTSEYMKNHGYDTTKELDMYEVFTEGYNVNTKFKDIETAYAWLKFATNGFNGSGLFIARESD